MAIDSAKLNWNGNVDHPSAGVANQSIPASVDLGTWGGNPTTGYVPCWADENGEISQERVDSCVLEDMYFEDFDITEDGNINIMDAVQYVGVERADISQYIRDSYIFGDTPVPEKGRVSNYTWGDVSFLIEIADGLGTGSRRAREERLRKFDKEKKKRLIHLICRVKGEKVYDEKKEIEDVQIKLDDVDLVINEVLEKIKVEGVNVL